MFTVKKSQVRVGYVKEEISMEPDSSETSVFLSAAQNGDISTVRDMLGKGDLVVSR